MRRGRKTFAETLTANNAADAYYAAMAGKEPRNQSVIRAPRPRAAPGADGRPLERDILRAIMGYLHLCPAVAFVGRFNSGTMEEAGRFVKMSTLDGFPDIHGCMRGGRALYIEVKRHDGRLSKSQSEFLERATSAGALAFVARSLDDVIAVIQ